MADCPCPLLDAGISQSACGFSVGGGKLALLGNKCLFNVTPHASLPNVIIDIVAKVPTAGPVFYNFAAKPETLGWNAPFTGNEGANSQHFVQTLVFDSQGGLSAEVMAVAEKLALDTFYAVVQSKESNGSGEERIYLLGRHDGLKATAAFEIKQGVARTDTSGIHVEMVSYETAGGYEIVPDPTVYTSSTPVQEFLDTLQGL